VGEGGEIYCDEPLLRFSLRVLLYDDENDDLHGDYVSTLTRGYASLGYGVRASF